MKTETPTERAYPESVEIQDALRELAAIREDVVAAPAMSNTCLDGVHSNYRESARNLLHYLALRRHDVRGLQIRLAALGLPSLRRAPSGGVTRPGYARRRSGGPAQTRRSLLATLLAGDCGAMTAKDLEDLTFVSQQADVVELSFVTRLETWNCSSSILHCWGRSSLLSC
jgi:hypothetical protein